MQQITSRETNQIERVEAQEDGFLGGLIPKHMGSPPILPAVKIRLGQQIKITVHEIIIVLLSCHKRRRHHIRHSGRRGGGGLRGGGRAEAAADAGAAALESGVRRRVLRGVLLYPHQLLRCPSEFKIEKEKVGF